MRLLIDTSVWSAALRRAESSAKAERLFELIECGSDVFTLGIIMQELLQGVKSKKQFDLLHNAMKRFPVLSLREEHHVFAAEIYNACRRKGKAQNTIHCLIASAAMMHDCELVTDDIDFQNIASIVRLRIFS